MPTYVAPTLQAATAALRGLLDMELLVDRYCHARNEVDRSWPRWAEIVIEHCTETSVAIRALAGADLGLRHVKLCQLTAPDMAHARAIKAAQDLAAEPQLTQSELVSREK
jgi:hypothetical protein